MKKTKNWWEGLATRYKIFLGIVLPTITLLGFVYTGWCVVDARYAKSQEVAMVSQQTQQNSIQIRLNYLYGVRDRMISQYGWGCDNCRPNERLLWDQTDAEIKYLEQKQMEWWKGR